MVKNLFSMREQWSRSGAENQVFIAVQLTNESKTPLNYDVKKMFRLEVFNESNETEELVPGVLDQGILEPGTTHDSDLIFSWTPLDESGLPVIGDLIVIVKDGAQPIRVSLISDNAT